MRSVRFLLLLAVLPSLAACGSQSSDAPGAISVLSPGLVREAAIPATWDELPDCDRATPDMDCVRRLFRPLNSALPFDIARVAASVVPNMGRVAPSVYLTAHHVLEGSSQFPYGCFFTEYRYAEGLQPIQGPGCSFLVAGGHPEVVRCRERFLPMRECVDTVPLEESFDLVLTRSVKSEPTYLPTRADPPLAGEEVFLVGYPRFSWLTEAEQAELRPLYPLVSRGFIRYAAGRGIVTDVPAFGGSSGSPLLDKEGAIVGVAYTLVAHLRDAGTATPPALEDPWSVATALDEKTVGIIRAAASTTPEP